MDHKRYTRQAEVEIRGRAALYLASLYHVQAHRVRQGQCLIRELSE